MGSLFGGGSSKTKVEGRDLTGEEKQLIAQQVELAKQQLLAVKNVMATSTGRAGVTEGLLEQQINIFQDALKEDTVTKEQDLIRQSAERAIEAGTIDIERARTEGIDDLIQRIAPSRGLRPTDSPILDRGNRILAESVRQTGQLTSSVRGQQADFERQLRERAFENRLRIGAALGDLSAREQGFNLSLATGIPANIQGTLAAIGASQPQTSRTSQPFSWETAASVAGGAGGLLSGIALVSSSIKLKHPDKPVDIEALLDRVKHLRLDWWRWRDRADGGRLHMGPYAEEMRDLFGVGHGEWYDVHDGFGVLFALVKAMAQRLNALEIQNAS